MGLHFNLWLNFLFESRSCNYFCSSNRANNFLEVFCCNRWNSFSSGSKSLAIFIFATSLFTLHLLDVVKVLLLIVFRVSFLATNLVLPAEECTTDWKEKNNNNGNHRAIFGDKHSIDFRFWRLLENEVHLACAKSSIDVGNLDVSHLANRILTFFEKVWALDVCFVNVHLFVNLYSIFNKTIAHGRIICVHIDFFLRVEASFNVQIVQLNDLIWSLGDI